MDGSKRLVEKPGFIGRIFGHNYELSDFDFSTMSALERRVFELRAERTNRIKKETDKFVEDSELVILEVFADGHSNESLLSLAAACFEQGYMQGLADEQQSQAKADEGFVEEDF